MKSIKSLAILGASLILPLSIYTANAKAETRNISIEYPHKMTQIAQNRFSGGDRKGKEERMNKIFQQLNLTPEQDREITAIRERNKAQKESLFQQMRTNKEEMRSLLNSNASTNRLRQQHEKMQTLGQQLSNNRFETMLEIREVLTPEQRSQFSQLIEQKRGRRNYRSR